MKILNTAIINIKKLTIPTLDVLIFSKSSYIENFHAKNEAIHHQKNGINMAT